MYEIHEGLDGRGNIDYLVVRVNAAGDWLYVHHFSTREAAENWVKYA